MSKQVIIVLVEGQSDETLLYERLRELYRGCEIRFEIKRGDIFYDNKNGSKSIKSIIGDCVKEIVQRRKYKKKDILSVIHIMDTDGCFIPAEKVIVDATQEVTTFYELNNIIVNSPKQKNNIEIRNRIRSTNVDTMTSVDSIVTKAYKYQIYYFSRNLEHVIFNEPNPIQDTKEENIEVFLEQIEIEGNSIEQYLSTYFIGVSGTSYSDMYRESWGIIKSNTNSLKRSTNVPLMFEYINRILEEF
ncbi:MAG: hypothetical protein N4A47_03085 [Clostridia bacterium]|jgi:hypothetical protein|nr:hypothetical protein [Clostridia bacterium]